MKKEDLTFDNALKKALKNELADKDMLSKYRK